MNKKNFYDIIFSIKSKEKGGAILEENLHEISSKDLIEMYNNIKDMKNFLDKEIKKVENSNE